MIFSKNVNELMTAYGYSLSYIISRNYPTIEKISDLAERTPRVLYLSVSLRQQDYRYGSAGGRTLRFGKASPKRARAHAPEFAAV